MNIRICSPQALFPSDENVAYARNIAETSNSEIIITDHIEEAVQGADVLYTDVWVSMDEEDKFKERIELLLPYQVNRNMIEKTGNEQVMFLHCLPSFHDLKTEIGRKVYEEYGIKEMEVTDEVFQSKHSFVFDQAVFIAMPKKGLVKAAIQFVESKPDRKAMITSLDKALDALLGQAGTIVEN